MAVYGTIRWRSRLDNIIHIQNKLKLIETDIKDAHSMQKTIDNVEPDYVFHLAAQSFVPTSWKAPSETVGTNILGTLNLFEAMRNSNSDPRIQVAGSSEEYGKVLPDELPIKESNPLRPLSPYAVSKVAAPILSDFSTFNYETCGILWMVKKYP